MTQTYISNINVITNRVVRSCCALVLYISVRATSRRLVSQKKYQGCGVVRRSFMHMKDQKKKGGKKIFHTVGSAEQPRWYNECIYWELDMIACIVRMNGNFEYFFLLRLYF